MLSYRCAWETGSAYTVHLSTVAQWVGLKELVWLGFRFVGGEVVGGLKRMTPFATEIVGWVTFSA